MMLTLHSLHNNLIFPLARPLIIFFFVSIICPLIYPVGCYYFTSIFYIHQGWISKSFQTMKKKLSEMQVTFNFLKPSDFLTLKIREMTINSVCVCRYKYYHCFVLFSKNFSLFLKYRRNVIIEFLYFSWNGSISSFSIEKFIGNEVHWTTLWS